MKSDTFFFACCLLGLAYVVYRPTPEAVCACLCFAGAFFLLKSIADGGSGGDSVSIREQATDRSRRYRRYRSESRRRYGHTYGHATHRNVLEPTSRRRSRAYLRESKERYGY